MPNFTSHPRPKHHISCSPSLYTLLAFDGSGVLFAALEGAAAQTFDPLKMILLLVTSSSLYGQYILKEGCYACSGHPRLMTLASSLSVSSLWLGFLMASNPFSLILTCLASSISLVSLNNVFS